MNLHFEELTGSGGARIGIASLDAEKTLNALSLPMILALGDRLDAWAKDPKIVCVLLRGNGSKAFCAGGEVRSLAQECREQPGEVPALAAQFFAAEYRLDYRLHTYPKPLICWATAMCSAAAWACCKALPCASSRQAAAWPCPKSASASIRM